MDDPPAPEFEGDLRCAEFWGCDLRDSTFRDVDLTGARIGHARIVDVEIDAYVERLVVNGVDVTDHVASLDPWSTLRRAELAATVDEMRTAWQMLSRHWDSLAESAGSLPTERRFERVDEQWSFAETLRHLVFVVDKWCQLPLRGGRFDPLGIPNTGSADAEWPGIDRDADPSWAQVFDAWSRRRGVVDDVVGGLDDTDLERMVDVLENGPHSVGDCVRTVFEEWYWHLRYADRDLAMLNGT